MVLGGGFDDFIEHIDRLIEQASILIATVDRIEKILAKST